MFCEADVRLYKIAKKTYDNRSFVSKKRNFIRNGENLWFWGPIQQHSDGVLKKRVPCPSVDLNVCTAYFLVLTLTFFSEPETFDDLHHSKMKKFEIINTWQTLNQPLLGNIIFEWPLMKSIKTFQMLCTKGTTIKSSIIVWLCLTRFS